MSQYVHNALIDQAVIRVKVSRYYDQLSTKGYRLALDIADCEDIEFN